MTKRIGPRALSWRHAAALVGAGVGAALLVGAVGLPDLERPIADASQTLGGWTYPVVGGLAFFETAAFVGLAVPGETAVVAAGVVAERGEVELVPMLAVVWLAAAAGDTASFLLGRRLGRPFLEAHGARLRLDAGRLARVERFFEYHGGKAVIAGRFVGFARAVTPFLAGASGFPIRRFVACSLVGALAWAALFTLVGYAFAGSIAAASGVATRIALGAVVIMTLLFVVRSRMRSSRLRRARHPGEPQRTHATDDAQRAADRGSGDDVEREVDAQVYARECDRDRQRKCRETQTGAEHSDGRGDGERHSGVPGEERRVVGGRHQGREPRHLGGRPLAVEDVRQRTDRKRGRQYAHPGGGERKRRPAAPEICPQRQGNQQRALDLPSREQGEPSRRKRPQEARGTNGARAFLVVVNGRASGTTSRVPQLLEAVTGELADRGLTVDAVVTQSEDELYAVLAEGRDRRVVLIGGDGSLHAAANAPLTRLPELALVPAGRANNIARALGIPTDRAGAVAVAAGAPARGVDALRVDTPERSVFALEALSAGFQAEARARYTADNSSDLHQGLSALAKAALAYEPYHVELRLDGRLVEMGGVAQLFLSNLPFFGFGFQVAPGTDPTDGRFEAILIEAGGRRELFLQLAAAYRGRPTQRRGVHRITARRAELTAELPLVADSVPLGTTTAMVTLERARVRVATPRLGLTA